MRKCFVGRNSSRSGGQSLIAGGGQSLIEVTVGIIVLVPVVICLIDLAVILLGVQTNDANCRNAARAAASGDPSEATFRAQTVMARSSMQANPPLISGSKLSTTVDVKVISQPITEPDIATGKQISPGGPITGTATVTSEVQIRPFVVHMVYGGKLPLTFTSKQSFPISYVAPAKQ